MSSDISFDWAFDAFIDGREYDESTTALFEMMRKAFLAGWTAAGGEAPTARSMVDFPGEHIRFPSLIDRERISNE